MVKVRAVRASGRCLRGGIAIVEGAFAARDDGEICSDRLVSFEPPTDPARSCSPDDLVSDILCVSSLLGAAARWSGRPSQRQVEEPVAGLSIVLRNECASGSHCSE